LFNRSPAGGVIRYENDSYFLARKEYPGNPWIICTLWLGRYFIKSAQPDKAKELIDWAIATALPSGVMSEQVDPVDKQQLSVSPLVWSHAELADILLLFYKPIN
jgi:glucoamylase